MRAFIFPGQGSQAVGMGKALADASSHAREVLQEVDDALGQSLSRLMAAGPAEELMLTEHAQPAIMANAIATLRVLEKEGGIRLADKAEYVAGHSLGEYTALCAAGAFDLATTARLLRTRGQAMQEAVPVGEGAMAVLLGADLELARVDRWRGSGRDRGRGRRHARLHGGQRQRSDAGGHLRPPRRDRARGGAGEGARRQARDAAAGIGAVSLRPDAARRRGDGKRAARR